MSGQCGVTSQAFNPPLVLKDGDAVAVTLAYDLTGTLTQAVLPQGWGNGSPNGLPSADGSGEGVGYTSCTDGVDSTSGDTVRTCFDEPAFTPSAAKVQ